MAEPLLLDTSAFVEDEPGADPVQSALLDADSGVLLLYDCSVTLTEVDHVTRQERNEGAAERRVRDLLGPPIR